VLPEIHTPVLVLSGAPAEMQPSMIARQVADRMPNSRYLERTDLDHFGPMTHPDLVASQITAYL
jgi:pimeloyl-ACP methyl ester carboxylesterase